MVSARIAVVILVGVVAWATPAAAYKCRYNCTEVKNRFCKTPLTVCPLPDGDKFAVERIELIRAKDPSEKCHAAMKRFLCALWYPKCLVDVQNVALAKGTFGDVDPVCWEVCIEAYTKCSYKATEANQKCTVFMNNEQVAPEKELQCFASGFRNALSALAVLAFVVCVQAVVGGVFVPD